MKRVKIAVLGSPSDMKDRFIETLTGMKIYSMDYDKNEEFLNDINTSKKISATFGRLEVREDLIMDIFSYNPKKNLNDLYAIMGKNINGIILYLYISKNKCIENAKNIKKLIEVDSVTPFIIVTDGWSNNPSISLIDIRNDLNISSSLLIIPCNSKEKESIKVVVDYLMDII